MIECKHEMDDGDVEPCDAEDLVRFQAACFRIRCRHCGARGFCVDDTGNFWEDPDTGELYEE